MDCPKCKTVHLRATKLEQGLSAMGCPNCEGAVISLLYYRDWLERSAPIVDPDACGTSTMEEVDESHSALTCPKCKKLMSKYKVSGDSNSRLDLCASCDEVWLDGGEWELLKSLELSRKMPTVFTEEWQRKLRKQALEEVREQRLLKVVEKDEIEEIKRIRMWLKEHPARQEIMFFLNHE
jgi:Zn-finger nucleic acid-binding protein